MTERPECFVAYPSNPPRLGDTIENAIEKLRGGGVVNVTSWRDLSSGGRLLVSAISEAIAECDVFICDLTTLNPNVLFELGAAIAQKKRIWPLLNVTREGAESEIRQFKPVSSVGYTGYQNSDNIQSEFYNERPYEDLDSTIFSDTIAPSLDEGSRDRLLYIKSAAETDAAIKLSRILSESELRQVTDDPSEVAVQPLTWYARNTYSAFATVAHFLSQEFEGAEAHNRKASLASGLAFGFGSELLMLAHEPFRTPIDYQEILKTHGTSSQCHDLAWAWLKEVEEGWEHRKGLVEDRREELRSRSDLERINLGDPVAENEEQELRNYFVETAEYRHALRANHAIYVGRRGAGKTANLLRLREQLSEDVRNHVCTIKPVAYELEGVLSMLRQSIAKSIRGYLVESFWKFLIYTELLRSVHRNLKEQPVYATRTSAEESLLEFVAEHSDIVLPEFSVRLESAVDRLTDMSVDGGLEQKRNRISELLHGEVLNRARAVLGETLQDREKVVILVDNLDKPWKDVEDIRDLSLLLFGLLEVTEAISKDFRKSDHWRQPVDLSLLVFLRSDIFAEVVQRAPERDKLPVQRISWDDMEALQRVLEDRFVVSSPEIQSREQVWENYFDDAVRGQSARDYLTDRILPRPRDLIYFAQAALTQAVNRGHAWIHTEDVVAAEKEYSQYALESLLVEDGFKPQTLEKLFYEFAGFPRVVRDGQIADAAERAGIARGRFGEAVGLLIERTFLGFEIRAGEFSYLSRLDRAGKLFSMAKRVAGARRPEEWRFEIHPAFRAYLEIQE